jgi:cytoskeletal protein CcmA (bactofilin family)
MRAGEYDANSTEHPPHSERDMEQMTEIDDATGQRGRGRTHGSNTTNVVTIGPRDSLSGTLTVDGDVRIEGTVEGEIHASGDVEIEPSAELRASVNGNNVSVRGSVTGDVSATARLSLGGSGTVTGDVRAARLQVDDGATVNGAITMSGGA